MKNLIRYILGTSNDSIFSKRNSHNRTVPLRFRKCFYFIPFFCPKDIIKQSQSCLYGNFSSFPFLKRKAFFNLSPEDADKSRDKKTGMFFISFQIFSVKHTTCPPPHTCMHIHTHTHTKTEKGRKKLQIQYKPQPYFTQTLPI